MRSDTSKTMPVVKEQRCERCGVTLQGQAVSGMCGKCLLTFALRSPDDPVVLNPSSAPTVISDSSNTCDDRPERIFGDYELVETIGRGGMGIVYKALEKPLNRTVAVKMMHQAADASPTGKLRFRIEAEAAAKLDHPNIVPTYQIGEVDGRPYFSMKLVEGGSLARKLRDLSLASHVGGESKANRNATRAAQTAIAQLMAKVARAVHFAHHHGVIHRDLKPNNILLDTEGEPHLTDFGIAKILEHDIGLTRTQDVLGTPAYMAPEQAAGRHVTAAADTYSLGAMLYELLTGQPPFKGNTPLETLRKAAEQEPVPPTAVISRVDADLGAICLKCLEKDPAQRYGSSLELAEDLERWLRREPIQARRIGAAGRIIRWARRNRVGAALIGTLIVGLAGALILLNMVSAERNKTAAVLQDVERSGQTNAQLLSLTVAMLHEQLEGLWLSNDRRLLRISSEQLAALSGLSISHVANKSSIERLAFGLTANESPVADSRKYAPLLRHLEDRLSERRGRPVRIDLHIYKFKEDRVQALATNGIHFARMGDAYYLKTRREYPGIRALVEAENRTKIKVFFARTNSGIRSLADLKGRSVAFGDEVAGVTFWGQVKLAEAGLKGSDLKEYVYLNSRTEFIEEVHELGYEEALRRRGWLHSTSDVIDDVVRGRYDAGVTSIGGFKRHEHRGLAVIPGSEFERTHNPWVAAAGLPADVANDLVEVLAGIRDEPCLLTVPSRPARFTRVTEETYATALSHVERIEALFPDPVATRTNISSNLSP